MHNVLSKSDEFTIFISDNNDKISLLKGEMEQ